MLEVTDLTKRYSDGRLALDALNLEVGPGEIYCLLGANGAGKTTALNLLMSFTRPTAGRVWINGIDAVRNPTEAKQHVAYLTESVALYGSLTAMQNLDFFARLGGRFDCSRDDYAMAMRRVGLPERSFTQPVRTFSKGMRQKLGIAMAMVKEAPLLLLDEPLASLDPQAAVELVETLKMLRSRGRAILLTTHDLFHAKQLADTIGILKEGRKVLTRTREELLYERLETLYLDYMRGTVVGAELDAEPSRSVS